MSEPLAPDTPPRRWTQALPERSRVAGVALKLIFELVVVFVGVYGAFAVESRERAREAGVRRAQFEAALVREIESLTANTRNAALGTGKLLAAYDAAWAAGRQPALQPMIEPVRVQTHMWEAILQSGGLDLFDVATVFHLSQFYNALNGGFEQLAQLRELSESMLLPQLGRPATTFYDPATGRLREQYRWWIDGIRHLNRDAVEITELGDRLVARLKTRGASTPP